ncbi:MAG: VWA domain-containing protein [Gammaproteobacteria bacterium]|nr:VWA domain-containing protein [Gammaproteobacteria bacterium]MBU1654723.1 VWA domain-containing protein [Gammaproteobacteria bacterium]MBU1959644.1 VWA domain-containing protein [Gammaproteobacteria bacterium]
MIVAALLAAGQAQAVASEETRPLLIEGKKNLFQRVLSKPGAQLVSIPGKGDAKPVTPFTAFYVFSRVDFEGRSWVQVGYDTHGKKGGWIPDQDLIEWNHGLTVSFRDPTGHSRVMLYRDAEQASKLGTGTNGAELDALYQAAISNQMPPDSPVVALQPSAYVDIKDDFYLVPIREFKDVFIGPEQGRLLRVSTVPHNAPGQEPQIQGTDQKSPKSLSTGVVFVIDSTLSMAPYIARTKAAVRKIYDQIAKKDPQGAAAFGLVAFRDDTSSVEGLEYRTMVFADLQKGATAKEFFSQVAEVETDKISNKDFIEDSYAGVKRAIDDISWGDFQARYIILITDAGAREGNDPLSGSKMSADTLRQLARDNNTAIFVLHLLTPTGADNHASAEQQYKALSLYPGIGDLYYGVKAGDVAEFGRVIDLLTDQLVAQMRHGSVSEEQTQEQVQQEPAVADDRQLTQLQEKVNKLGYALRMQYLDQPRKGNIPQVFDAWMVDRDPKEPQRKTVDVRVLLTRDQLSELYQMLREVLETAEEGLLSPRNFLDDIKSLAATASRDPERMAGSTRSSGANNLADMGFMKEYIEGLPYTGEVMSVSLEDWRNWPAKRQLEFIQRLEEKVSYYRALHDHTDLWVSLDGGPVGGDSVFPVPLDMLP